MTKVLILLSFLSMPTWAVDFNCEAHGLVDVYVSGGDNKPLNIMMMDLYFTEEAKTIQTFEYDETSEEVNFKLHAAKDDWFLRMETVNNKGWIEMDYRGIMQQHEDLDCTFEDSSR